MACGFAERSGGALFIESALGRGTSVHLWFPLSQDGTARAFKLPGGSTISNSSRDVIGRLLLVDDESLVGETLALEIEAEGFAVLPAQGGPEALALLDAGEELHLW